jgi:hypothetical protein
MFMPHSKGILATFNGFAIEETFKISVELNIRNTVFNTNIEEFPLRLLSSYYFLLSIISIVVNGQIICQPLEF